MSIISDENRNVQLNNSMIVGPTFPLNGWRFWIPWSILYITLYVLKGFWMAIIGSIIIYGLIYLVLSLKYQSALFPMIYFKCPHCNYNMYIRLNNEKKDDDYYLKKNQNHNTNCPKCTKEMGITYVYVMELENSRLKELSRSERNSKKKYNWKIIIPFIGVIAIVLYMVSNNSTETGKLYYTDGTLKYEGEIKGDNENGLGKAYDENGNLFFEGEFIDGNPNLNGYAKNYWENGNLMFEGTLKEGERLEGNVYNEDGSFMGYLSYPPISIIGEWVAGDVLNSGDTYEIEFTKDSSLKASGNSSFNGSYEFENYDSDERVADIIMNVKGEEGFTGGSIQFQNKNLFTLTNDLGEAIMFIRKGTDGYSD